MRTSLLQDNLKNALKLAGKSISKAKRYGLPVLESVKLSTHEGALYAETSDLSTAVRVRVSARIDADGAICVPYEKFSKLVDRLSPERVDLEGVQRTLSLSLSCGASTATFNGIDAEDFPLIDWPKDQEANDNPTVLIPASVLMSMITEVIYAAAKDDDRPVLNSICIEYKDSTLMLTACDSYRLAHQEHRFAVPSFDGEFSVIVPLHAIEKFKSLFADEIKANDDLHLVVDDEALFIVAGSTEFMIALEKGTYPDYNQITFSNDAYTTMVDPMSLSALLKRAEVFSLGADLITDKEQRVMRVKASSSEFGETEGLTDVKVIGDAVEARYTIAYLLDVLGKAGDSELRFDFKKNVLPYDRSEAKGSYVLKITKPNGAYHLLMPRQAG